MFLTQVFNLVTNMNCINQPTIRMRRCSTPGNQKSGQIQLIFGPMFSGKSTELIRRLKRYQIANYSCLIVKYANDVRYNSESIATHDKQTLKAVSTTKLFNLMDAIDDASYDVIGIDEGQFFPDVVEFCEKMANEGKTVIVAALDGTFQRKEFGSILNLVPLAENVIKLSAVCMLCFGEGSYTKRISEDKELEVIGGAEKYMAVCRRCYFSQGKIAASPRVPFKTLCQNEMDDSEVQIFPPKKALFDSNGCNRIQAESMT